MAIFPVRHLLNDIKMQLYFSFKVTVPIGTYTEQQLNAAVWSYFQLGHILSNIKSQLIPYIGHIRCWNIYTQEQEKRKSYYP